MQMVFQESRIKLFDQWLVTKSEEEERWPVSDVEMVPWIQTWIFGRDTVFEQEYDIPLNIYICCLWCIQVEIANAYLGIQFCL